MCYGPAKIDQKSISQILGHMARIRVDDLSRGYLIGADDLA